MRHQPTLNADITCECPACKKPCKDIHSLIRHLCKCHFGEDGPCYVCWCGVSLWDKQIQYHLEANDGFFTHYHASMLGVTP